MNKDNIYTYIQEILEVPKKFEDLIAELKSIGLPKRHLLELYDCVWSYKQGNQIQKMLFAGKQKNVSLTMERYHKVLLDIGNKLRLYHPIRFMKLFEAYFYPKC